tara:strand:+ start:940 stop:1482 length:543 start_codon:yes stop_codon:yes gene_type:complete
MSKNNSPLKFIGGMMGNAAASLSGGSNNSNNGFQGIMGGFLNNPGNLAAQALMARQQAQQAQQAPVNPGFNTDPNNASSAISESIISQADMNRRQDRNSGTGQITQLMHEMNSDTPMVRPMASKPRMRPGMGYSSAVSPFSPPELNTGNSLYGSEQQKQEIMNPMPIANIDATGMNSLYS